MARPLYIPTSDVIQFFLILTSTWCCHCILILVILWYLIMVLVCVFLMANDVEHLFVCLFAMCIFYSMEMSFPVFCLHLFSDLDFLKFSFENSLYIIDTSHFSHMGFSNVFSQCVIWVFIHLKRIFYEAFLIHLMRSNFLFLLLLIILLLSSLRIPHLALDAKDFLLFFPLCFLRLWSTLIYFFI